MKPFNVTHPIIIPLQLTRVTRYFNVRQSTLEEIEDQDIQRIELTMEAPLWILSSPEFSSQEHSMIYQKLLCHPYHSSKRTAYDAADVMCHNNFATVLESFVIFSLLWVIQVHTKKVPVVDYLVLANEWYVSSKIALIQCGAPQNVVLHSVAPILVTAVQDKWSSLEEQKTSE